MFALLFILTLNCFDFEVLAENSNGVKVYLRVEGTENTVMEGEVEADTVIEALQILGKEKNINVILKININNQQIYSIDNITNDKFSKGDSWNVSVFRKNELVVSENIEKMKLLNGDEVVIYYGYKNITPVEINVSEKVENDVLKLQASHKISQWINNEGKWELELTEDYLENIKVHLKSESVSQSVYEKVYTTDKDGKVEFEIEELNAYTYFLEGYKKSSVPDIVKTKDKIIISGIDENEKLTRAKLTAFLINYYGIKNEKTEKIEIEKVFTDIKLDSKYKEYLELAWSEGIIKGNGDNTFRPDDEITLQEFISILDNIFCEKEKEDIKVTQDTLLDCDNWAVECIENVVKKRIIKNGEYNWTKSVELKDIIEILF